MITQPIDLRLDELQDGARISGTLARWYAENGCAAIALSRCHRRCLQAIYSGWSVNVGTEGWPASTDTSGFRVVLAQQWQAGHVMGWTSPGQLLTAFATTEDRAYLRSLCQLKVAHAKYLVYGRLMHPPMLRLVGGAEVPSAAWCGHSFGPACCDFPALTAALWRGADGSMALTAVNTDANATLTFTATMREIADVTHTLPPRSAAVLIVRPAAV